MLKKIQMELLGVARIVTGRTQIRLELELGATFRDIVRRMSEQYPALLGNVIRPDQETLQPPNVFNVNGQRTITAGQMGERPGDGDCIILMSMSAGG